MARFHSEKRDYAKSLIYLGLVLLSSALFFGLLSALQYVVPGLWRDTLSFEKLRPLHVSSAVFWIISAAVGVLCSYWKEHRGRPTRFAAAVRWQYYLFLGSFALILLSYFFGVFGGREYWEFHPFFAIPIVLAWLILLVSFVLEIKSLKKQPVYVWMWLTGIVFFFFTYLESNLWLVPGISKHLVKDMTIQWKSYGALVGSWNMLIYGSSIYLMDKIAGNQKYSLSNIAFWLYLLGLTNLMFNWGHHIYTLPTLPFVKHFAYLVSMTELLLFGRIIWLWRSSLSTARKHFHLFPFKFLMAADFWVFFTLANAIPLSVPAINVLMHGTHAIVAHTMGATIGINSMLLLAFAYDLLGKRQLQQRRLRLAEIGYWVINGSLLVFLVALFVAGMMKSHWQMAQPKVDFGTMMRSLRPWFYLFFTAGLGLATGFALVLMPLFRNRAAQVEEDQNTAIHHVGSGQQAEIQEVN